jgi:parallel beta-helix repeat protein
MMSLTKVTYSMIEGSSASVLDFGADPTGTTECSAEIQAALDSGAESIYLPEGTYDVGTQLVISSKVRFYGPGTINETTLLDATILVDTVDGVCIEGITFTGPETLVAWNAGGAAYRQAFKAFIKFDTCKNGVVRDVISSGKRGVVWLNDCQKMQIDANRHNGFLGDITSPAPDSNWYSCFIVQGGRENHLTNNEGFSCGSVVLCANESSFNMVSNTTGRESHDNFIYNSSGNYSSFVGGTFENGLGSGVKARGSGHTVSGFTIKGCGSGGPSISLTGNGLTPDAFGANGFGTVCYGNTITGSAGHAISVGEQDGLYPRDFIVANNTIENHTGTAGFAAVIVTAERGVKVVSNIVRGSTASYALGIFGVGSGNRAFDYDISGNTISNCVVGMRVQNVDDSLIANNSVNANSGAAFNFRLCDNNFITGNRSVTGTGIQLSAVLGEECFNNVCVNNDVPSQSGAANNVTALPIEYEVGVWSPTYTTTGTDFTSITYDAEVQGFYTKIGRLVTISGFIRTDAITVGGATGDVVVGGLPFSVSNGGTGARSAVAVTRLENFAGDYPSTSYLPRNESFIRLQYRATSNGDDVALEIADLGTGANANGFAFSATYVTDL